MSVIGQVWWLNLLLAGLAGMVLGGVFQALRERQTRLAEVDAMHRRCWAEQDRWLDEHAQQSEAAERARLDALAQAKTLGNARDDALLALAQCEVACAGLEAEIASLREGAALTDQALRELADARDESLQTVERVRREMDGARAGYRQAEQALCQQLLSLERQVSAERSAHRREVQALRVQCDELNELLAASRAEWLLVQAKQARERESLHVHAAEHQQVCEARDALRDEVRKLLDLLDQSDTAQAALQHRANVLEQQMAIGQRQLEALRLGPRGEPVRTPLTRIGATAPAANVVPPGSAGAAGGREPRPFERLPDSPPPDNLQRIKGIGPSNQVWLNRCGIWYLWQIAALKAEEQQWLAGHLPRFGRRIYRENWVAQAKALLDGQRCERRVFPAQLPPGVSDRRRVSAPTEPERMAA
jgi:predicted flap endonuclease-1-like 5' DNA nuclease